MNLDKVDIYLDGRYQTSAPLSDHTTTLMLDLTQVDGDAVEFELRTSCSFMSGDGRELSYLLEEVALFTDGHKQVLF